MSLSSLITTLPKYQVTLPVSGMKVEYRPFIVKEEKMLLMAAESKDEKMMTSTIKQIVQACTEGKVDISKLATTDVEFLFLQLRSDSIGETVRPSVKCSSCDAPNDIEINLKQIKVVSKPNHDKKIHIVSDVYVIMKHPTMIDMEKVDSKEGEIDRAFSLIGRCIEKVINGDTVYNTSEIDDNEVKNFIENLPQSQFRKLLDFIESMPTMQCDVSFKCKKCAHENNAVLKGLSSFFS